MMKRLVLLLLLMMLGSIVFAQEDDAPLFIPIGGGYTDTYPGFLEAVMSKMDEGDDLLYIVVMPLAYSTDPSQLSADDLILNSRDSERRRRQLEDACREVAGEAVTCQVVVAPIYTTELAESEIALDYFDEDLDGIYFLGGDQTTAMQVVINTPLEEALATAFAEGVVMGGNSAGLAVQSRAMIAGYNEGFDENNGFAEGAVDVWNSDEARGLSFGVENVLLEQHFFEFVRLPRLINAVVQADLPHLAIGMDGYTGAYLQNGVLSNVFGLYTGIVLDAESLGAVESANYSGGSLSVRNIVVHMLAPGDFSYDTNTMQHSLVPTLTTVDRSATTLAYTGSGRLILAGNAATLLATDTLPLEGSTVVLAVNYPEGEAQAAIDAISAELSGEVTSEIVADAISSDLSSFQNIIVTGADLSSFDPAILVPVVEAMDEGKTVILSNAAAAVAGASYSAHGATREATDENPYATEEDVQGALVVSNTTIAEGLGLVGAAIEPQVISDARFGRMFALAYANPSLVAVGLPDDAGLVFSSEGVTVVGANSVVTLDLSAATLAEGENGGFVWANGLLDTFANGETVSFASAE
jgi:cyanophycinase